MNAGEYQDKSDMVPTEEDIKTKHVELEQFWLGMQQRFSKRFWHEVKMSVIENMLQETVEIQLRGHIYGETAKKISVKYPATWWQAFKSECFPYWLRRRFPAKFTEETFDVRVLYPDINVSLPEDEHILTIVRTYNGKG